MAARAAPRSLFAFSRMSPRPETAFPATSNSAPACTMSLTVSSATPPSTSMRNDSASVCKRGNVAVGILDHQVAVENGVGKRFAQRSHDRRANRDVRHEVTIHNVQVQHRATAFERGFSVVGEPREVRGEYRRGQFN